MFPTTPTYIRPRQRHELRPATRVVKGHAQARLELPRVKAPVQEPRLLLRSPHYLRSMNDRGSRAARLTNSMSLDTFLNDESAKDTAFRCNHDIGEAVRQMTAT